MNLALESYLKYDSTPSPDPYRRRCFHHQVTQASLLGGGAFGANSPPIFPLALLHPFSSFVIGCRVGVGFAVAVRVPRAADVRLCLCSFTVAAALPLTSDDRVVQRGLFSYPRAGAADSSGCRVAPLVDPPG